MKIMASKFKSSAKKILHTVIGQLNQSPPSITKPDLAPSFNELDNFMVTHCNFDNPISYFRLVTDHCLGQERTFPLFI